MLSLPLPPARGARLLARAVREVRRRLAAKETHVHKVADAHYDVFFAAAKAALAKGRAAAKAAGPAGAAEAAAKAIAAAIRASLPRPLGACLGAAGQATIAALPQPRQAEASRQLANDDPKLTMSFDNTDPNSIAWALEHAGELANDLSDTTRDAIKAAIAQQLEEGDDPSDLIDAIAEAIGDDARAEVIARTETMAAANEGQRQGWDQAVENGLLPDDAKRVWIATEVGACPDCEDLDGQTADLDGEYPDDGGDGPPLHPNCRCTEGIANDNA